MQVSCDARRRLDAHHMQELRAQMMTYRSVYSFFVCSFHLTHSFSSSSTFLASLLFTPRSCLVRRKVCTGFVGFRCQSAEYVVGVDGVYDVCCESGTELSRSWEHANARIAAVKVDVRSDLLPQIRFDASHQLHERDGPHIRPPSNADTRRS